MLANVFSNTTPPRVEKAEGVPLVGLALSLCLMAAIAALAFVEPAGLWAGGLISNRIRRGSEFGRQVAVDFQSDADFHECWSCPVQFTLPTFHISQQPNTFYC